MKERLGYVFFDRFTRAVYDISFFLEIYYPSRTARGGGGGGEGIWNVSTLIVFIAIESVHTIPAVDLRGDEIHTVVGMFALDYDIVRWRKICENYAGAGCGDQERLFEVW